MLSDWSSFFAMTGSAGATLVGLLFVVVTLGTGLPTSRTMDIARASLTPALYSFSGILPQSMIALVPRPSDWPSGVIFVAMGINGVIYRIRAIHFRAAELDRLLTSGLSALGGGFNRSMQWSG